MDKSRVQATSRDVQLTMTRRRMRSPSAVGRMTSPPVTNTPGSDKGRPMLAARALFRGPAHVFVDIDDEMERLIGREVIGVPAREAFCGPNHEPSQRLMDRVFRTGDPALISVPSVEGVVGSVLIVPVYHYSRVWGLVTSWSPRPMHVFSPVPRVPRVRALAHP